MRLSKTIAFSIIFSILVQPLGLASPVFAGTVDMEYSDLDHLHAPSRTSVCSSAVDCATENYVYDANGNLLNDGERTIFWNQDNLPTRIEKDGKIVEFFYDANGRRIVKQSGEDKTVYVNQYYQTPDTKYYFANGRTALLRQGFGGSSTPTYLHTDHLGSTVLATDSNSQKLTEPLSYFPYGASTNAYSLMPSAYLFTGQEEDPESDLSNYNARLYNPTTGVFISADTVGGGNRYAYAANNPMRFTDPSGNNVWDEIKRWWGEISGDLSPLDMLTFSPNIWAPGLSERVAQDLQEEAAHQHDPLFYVSIGDESFPGPSMFQLKMATSYGMVQVYGGPAQAAGQAGAPFFKSAKDSTTALRHGEAFPGGGAGEFEALRELANIDPAHTVTPYRLTSEGIEMESLGQSLEYYLSANPGETERIVFELEATVGRYHAAAAYHGDIRMDNILMRRDTPVFIDALEQRTHLIGEMQRFDLTRLSRIVAFIRRFF